MRLILDLTLPVESRLMAATRRILALYLTEFGTAPHVVDEVILAMDEACANVVLHAYPEGYEGHYLVHADLEQDRILIEVVDEGTGFDIMGKLPPRDEDAHLAPSGRGLEVMRRLMTTVEVESPTAAGGTRLRLTRLLNGACE